MAVEILAKVFYISRPVIYMLERSYSTPVESSHHFGDFTFETSGLLCQAALDIIRENGHCLHPTINRRNSQQGVFPATAAAVVLGTSGTDPRQRDPFWE